MNTEQQIRDTYRRSRSAEAGHLGRLPRHQPAPTMEDDMQTIDQLTDRLIAAETDVETRFEAGQQPAPGSAMEAQMRAYHRLAGRIRARDPQHPALAADPR